MMIYLIHTQLLAEAHTARACAESFDAPAVAVFLPPPC